MAHLEKTTITVSPLTWKALDRHEHYFRFNWSCPYAWDANAGKFIYNGKLKTLKCWMLNLFATALNLSLLLSCLGVCNFSKSHCPFSSTELILIGIWTVLAALSASFDVAFLLYSEDAIFGFNQLRRFNSTLGRAGMSSIFKNFMRFHPNTGRGRCSPGPGPGAPGSDRIDLVGYSYNGIAMIGAVYPYLLTFFGVIIFHLDPLYYTMKHLDLLPPFHSHPLIRLIFTSVRVLLTHPPILQGVRILTLIAIFIGTLMGMLMEAVGKLRGGAVGMIAIVVEWRSWATHHATLEIILKMLHPFLSPVVLVAMGSALGLDVLINYATFKLYKTIPMPFYLYFPSSAVLIPGIIQLLLPAMGSLVEGDRKLHRQWALYRWSCREKKGFGRKLRSLRTLKIYAGLPGTKMFPLVSSTKGTFFKAMIDYTISALLFL